MKVIRVITIMTKVMRVRITLMAERYVGTVSFPTTKVRLDTLSLWSGIACARGGPKGDKGRFMFRERLMEDDLPMLRSSRCRASVLPQLAEHWPSQL